MSGITYPYTVTNSTYSCTYYNATQVSCVQNAPPAPTQNFWDVPTIFFGLPRWEFYAIIGFMMVMSILVVYLVFRRRKGVDYSPETVLMIFDPDGTSEPHYIAPEDEGASFVDFMSADGFDVYKKKARVPISIPSEDMTTKSRLFFNPRGSDICVEPEEEFPTHRLKDTVASEVVTDQANQFQELNKGFRTGGLTSTHKFVLILIIVAGLAFGVILDAAFLHAGVPH